ncbi:cupin domain-containing protein [Saccharomonospora azurea]
MRSAVQPLQRCVGDVDRFADEVWGRRAWVHGPTADGFEDLLSLDGVDELLTQHSLRSPAFRLVRDGRTVPLSDCTRTARIGGTSVSGVADPARVLAAVEDGATLVLQGLHRYWPPLVGFCRELELELGHPCQVNAYVTPPGAQGLRPHTDSHDVFVLQAFGSKSWQVWPAPAADAGDTGDTEADGVEDVELRAGMALYLPTGTRHAARAQHVVSGHLTVGIHPTRWRDLIESAVARVLREPAWDAPLPVRYHRQPESVADELRRQLKQVGAQLMAADPVEPVGERVERFLTTRPPVLRGGLLDRLRLSTLDDTTRVRRRAGSVCELRAGDAGVLRVLLGDRELRVPDRLEPAMREIAAARGTVTVGDLAGGLDETSRLVLVRRLVREGLLEVVDA